MNYQIIYADPPWEYRKSGGLKSGRGLAKSFYKTMPLEDIKALPVHEICAKDCYLFMWVTGPTMQEGLDVLKAWGFDFFTVAFTWVKTNLRSTDTLFWGMGTTTRANPEYVLLGRKGKLERVQRNVHSVVMAPVMAHSKKPDEVRDCIIRLYGNLRRIELFARCSTEGWDVFGDQVSESVELLRGKEKDGG